MNKIFPLPQISEFINKLGKYVFHWEKRNFQPIGNLAHTTECLTSGKAMYIYIDCLILTQADNM